MQLLAMSLLNRCRVSLQMTHQEIDQNTDTFKLLSQQRLVGVKGPNQRPAKWFAGLFVFSIKFKIKRKIAMNIADAFLATGTGILAAVVISGILIITWYLCVTTPRRTKR